MKPEEINQRYQALTQAETNLLEEIKQIQVTFAQKQADLNATQGAKQECQYWLKASIAAIAPPDIKKKKTTKPKQETTNG